MAGTFTDFLSGLLAFESGWDRERYDAGIITDAQLDYWARGSVQDYFPAHSSWSDLTDAEWETMAYRSLNSFGFVGYQFGEALLIDLGYYDDDFYYGNGASTITWDGTWTGKNGVTSLEDFMTKEAQDVAIQEAFGHNLGIIEDGLSAAGKSLDDYLGTTINGIAVTLTGVLASAHLRGAPAVVDLFLYGTLSNDEYGTSILQYMEQFGGHDAPAVADLIQYFEDRLTGDEGLGGPGDTVAGGNGTAGVTADTADVVVDWAWGTNNVVTDFDPSSDSIYVGWFNSGHIDVTESGGNVVFSIPSNNQSITLQGVTLAELSAANFSIEDSSAAQEILALVGQDEGSPGTGDEPGDVADGSTDGGTDSGDTGTDTGDPGPGGDTVVAGNGTAGVTAATATVAIDWAWGSNEVVTDLDPSSDSIYIGWFTSGHIDVSEAGGDVVFSIPSNNQTVTLQDVSLSELSEANFTIKDGGAAQEILALVGQDETGGDGDVPPADTPDDTPSVPVAGNGTTDTVHVTWNWGAEEIVSDFAVSEDVLDFGALSANGVAISESGGDLHIEVVGNGGHSYVIENVQAEDLSAANLSAPNWNDDVLHGSNGVVAQLAALGYDEIA
jgi:hypothetical protein